MNQKLFWKFPDVSALKMSSFRLNVWMYLIGINCLFEKIKIELAESKITSRYFEYASSIAFPRKFQISTGPLFSIFVQIAVSKRSYNAICPWDWCFSGAKASLPLKNNEFRTFETEKLLSMPKEKSNQIAATTWWSFSKGL